MRITKEGQAACAALWDKLADDKTAVTADADLSGDVITDGLFYESKPRPGYCFQAGQFKIASPRNVDEANEAVAKLAGFWSDAFQSLGRTVKTVVRGGAEAVDPSWPRFTEVAEAVERAHKGGPKAQFRAVEKLYRGAASDAMAAQAAASGISPAQKAQIGLAGALVATPLAVGAAGAHSAYVKHEYAKVLNGLESDPAFENISDKQNLRDAYALMQKYSPSIALDPMVARSFVMTLVTHPDLSHLELAQNLMDAEKKYDESRAFSRSFDDRVRKLTRHPLAEPFVGGGGGGGKKGK